MSDITTNWDSQNLRGDWSQFGAALQSGNDTVTAVLLSLFTDRVANADDVIPDGTTDPRGWWADDAKYPIGSRLWLLGREKQVDSVPQRARDYCTEALKWMIDDGVVTKFDITADWVRDKVLGVGVTAYPAQGAPITVTLQATREAAGFSFSVRPPAAPTTLAALSPAHSPSPSPAPAPGPAPGPTDSAAATTIPELAVHPVDWLQIDKYFIDDGVWGTASRNPSVDPDLTRGSASYQYQQLIERSLIKNVEDGSIAARFRFNWPQFNSLGHSTDPNVNPNYNEVKTYMSIITGKKPGFYGADIYPAYQTAVRAPDGVASTPAPGPSLFPPTSIVDNWQTAGGSLIQIAPSGGTPNSSIFPMQLPLTGKTLRSRGKIAHKVPVTGLGHASFDFFLTAQGPQVNGFSNSSVTHEIMVPLGNWLHYGQFGYRAPSWYDHDWVSPSGVTYHVYYAKNIGRNDVSGIYDFAGSNSDGTYPGLRYNFGGLNPNFTNEETGQPRIGWKFIVFQHSGETHPVDANGMFVCDFVAMMEHLATCKDSRGVNVIQNNEYLPSVEVGLEIVYGAGDILFDKYLVQAANTLVAPPPVPA